jgi:hypothetical protein
MVDMEYSIGAVSSSSDTSLWLLLFRDSSISIKFMVTCVVLIEPGIVVVEIVKPAHE